MRGQQQIAADAAKMFTNEKNVDLQNAQRMYDKITVDDKQQLNNTIDSLNQALADKTVSIQTQMNKDLALANKLNEDAETEHQNNLTAIDQKGIADRIQLNVDYANTYGNMTGGVVPNSLGNGQWAQIGNTPNQSIIAQATPAVSASQQQQIDNEMAGFYNAFEVERLLPLNTLMPWRFINKKRHLHSQKASKESQQDLCLR